MIFFFFVFSKRKRVTEEVRRVKGFQMVRDSLKFVRFENFDQRIVKVYSLRWKKNGKLLHYPNQKSFWFSRMLKKKMNKFLLHS